MIGSGGFNAISRPTVAENTKLVKSGEEDG
jgi:hypothetical protein